MFNIRDYLPSKIKKTPSGWWTLNCPACVHNGETPDKRKRGGFKFDSVGGWVYHCFNCNFATKFSPTSAPSKKTKNLLLWLGVPQAEIDKLSLETLKNRQELGIPNIEDKIYLNKFQSKFQYFEPHPLPPGAKRITLNDKWAVDYLKNERGLSFLSYPFYITPDDKGRERKRIIIPYYNKKHIVGWTSRYLDNRTPKYKNEHQQPGYIFGIEMQKENWRFGIVTEGPFDAISISGMALLHNEISDAQRESLRRLNKEIIIVPDQDKAGLTLAEEAIDLGFSLSIPEWDDDIKDVNAATKRYGKVGVIASILNNRSTNKIHATLILNNFKKRKGL